MFIVIEYFNYRKNSTINILGYSNDENKAKDFAYKKALALYDENVVDLKNDSSFDEYVVLEGDIIAQYSSCYGYDKMVYGVVKIDELK